MSKLKPYSTTILTLCGIIMVGMGLYFVLLRPVLLPEDSRYIGLYVADLQTTAPNLADWLRRVFTVMGAFMLTTGLLVVYIARTSFRVKSKGVSAIITVTGLTSIGLMVIVNFLINSDFKWLLFSIAVLWGIALLLYYFENR